MKKMMTMTAAALVAGGLQAVTVTPEITREALVNPGMGWVYYHYDDSNWNYGGETAPGDTLDWYPGCSTIYIRLPWADLEPVEGQFRWDVIDSVIQPWIAAGKEFAFRFTCNESAYRWAVPKWLPATGAKGQMRLMRKKPTQAGYELWEPEWDDPVFLEKYGNFLAAAARRWDGDPALAFIDVGSFGMWGEGHTGYTSKLPPEKTREVALLHARLLKRHFARSPIVISDDVAGGGWNRVEDTPCLVELRKMGIGLRDDSIMCSPKPNQWLSDGWARKFVAAGLPVVVESCHYYPSRNYRFRGGLLQSTVAYQASYQGIHWWPREHLELNRDEIAEVNLRLGYRFVPRRIEYPAEVKVGAPVEIRTTWVNLGVAPTRRDHVAAWTLLDEKGTVQWISVDESFDFRSLPPTLEAGEKPVERVSAVRFGWDWPTCDTYYASSDPDLRHDGTRRNLHGTRVKTLAPDRYTLALSVGLRNGTPVVALPLTSQIGDTRRYALGTVVVKDRERDLL